MSTMAETATATQVNSLAELPTDRVLGIYSYAHRKWVTTTGEEGFYYHRMLDLAITELQSRDDAVARDWQASSL